MVQVRLLPRQDRLAGKVLLLLRVAVIGRHSGGLPRAGTRNAGGELPQPSLRRKDQKRKSTQFKCPSACACPCVCVCVSVFIAGAAHATTVDFGAEAAASRDT